MLDFKAVFVFIQILFHFILFFYLIRSFVTRNKMITKIVLGNCQTIISTKYSNNYHLETNPLIHRIIGTTN